MTWTTRFGRRNTLVLAFGGFVLLLASCQLVAGIESRKLDPVLSGCTLPQTGVVQVRVANLVPTSDVVDVCLRPSGTSDWGRPIILNGGTDCGSASTGIGAQGFGYNTVSQPFYAPATTVDVQMVSAGSVCGSNVLTESDGLSLATNAVTTLVRVGGNGVSQQIVALPEEDSQNTGSQRIRFVHAAPGTGPLDFGNTASATLPTTLSIAFFSQPIAFGGTVPSGATTTFASASVGDNGYLGLITGPFVIGASIDGAGNKAILTYQLPGISATYSLYAVGVSGDNLHPLRGLICDEDSGVTNSGPPLLESCVLTPLSNISVDVFNASLYGPASPNFQPRRDAVPGAIHARDSDVICVVEVDEDTDKNAILKQATTTVPGGAGPYGYVYSPTTDLSTPFTNPKDQNGNVPPTPTEPPCANVPLADVTAAVQCGQTKCSNAGPNDPTGALLGSTSCLEDDCALPLITVQSDAQGQKPSGVDCFNCLIAYMAADTSWGDTQNNCTNDTRPPMAFSGAMNSMILSRYPLANTDVLVLPSTLYRRSVLYAQVQLEDQTVDVYCGFLMTTLNYNILQYDGNYGGDADASATGWENEQLYEAQQMIQWVGQKSGDAGSGNPAIIVGDWRSSLAAPSGAVAPAGTFLPTGLSENTMNALNGAGWTQATPPQGSTSSTWATQCNFCPTQENVYNGNSDSYFVAQPYIVGWPNASTAVIDESLQFTANTVPLGTTADAGMGPVSQYYGVNVVVIRPH